ncbi:unnamed protein product [Eretmochelys imbricata]
MGEFLRRKSELEQEYSRGLEKLSERFTTRAALGQGAPQERAGPAIPSSVLAAGAEANPPGRPGPRGPERYLCGAPVAAPGPAQRRPGRAVKKSRDLEQQMQDELLTMISELQMAMKAYQTHHAESQSAENKLRDAERQEEKRGARQPAEPGRHRARQDRPALLPPQGGTAGGEASRPVPGSPGEVHRGAERLSPAPAGHERRDQQLLPLGRLRHPRLLGPRVPSLPGPPAADVPGGRGPGPELLAGGAGGSGGGRAGPGPPRGQGPADGGQPSHLLPPPRASSTTPMKATRCRRSRPWGPCARSCCGIGRTSRRG